MSNKNPYEVRLDILRMAQEMLDREMSIKEQAYLQQIETLRSTNIGGVNAFAQDNALQMYTPEEVISKASTLYNFVADTSTSPSRSVYKMSEIEEKYRK
jgi:3-dehydroquinate dehydratase